MEVLRLTHAPTRKEQSSSNAIIDFGLFFTHLVPLSKSLKKIGVNSSFFSSGASLKFAEKIFDFDVQRTSLPQNPYFFPFGVGLSKFLSQKGSKKFDIIHSHNPSYAYYFALNPGALGTRPLFITWHGFFPFEKYADGWIHKFLLKRLAQFAYFIPINEPSVKQLIKLGVPKERMRLITTGFDLSSYKVKKKNGEYILFVGRLIDWKNPKSVLLAFEKILKKFKNEKLVFVGNGPLEEELKAIAFKVGISSRVEFFGSVPLSEIPMTYSRAKLLVVPHLYDSFGKTIIEGLASGIPIVCTDDDVPNDLMPFLNLIPTKEATNVLLLEKKLSAVLSDSKSAELKAKKGKVFVRKNYTWEVAAGKIKRFYLESL